MKGKLTAAVLVCGLLLTAGMASGAMVKIGELTLRADGGFTPRELPRRSFAPIEFHGFAKVTHASGAVPPVLRRATIDFDRDGRLTTRGLPACAPARIQSATPKAARAACRRAIVGKGRVEALIARDGQAPLPARSALTIFNGPRQNGSATVVLHAQARVPEVETFAVVVPVRRRSGGFAYRATLLMPPIAADRGSLVYVKAKIGKRYRFRGSKLSYVSARCSDNVLETLGRFDFADGTVIYGPVMKACRFR